MFVYPTIGLTLRFCTSQADTKCKLRTSSMKEKCSTIRQKQNTYCPCEVKGLRSSFIQWKVSSCDCEYNGQTWDTRFPGPDLIDDCAHFAACLPSLCLCLLFQFQFEYFVVGNSHRLEISFWPEVRRRRMGSMIVKQGSQVRGQAGPRDPSGPVTWRYCSSLHHAPSPTKSLWLNLNLGQ